MKLYNQLRHFANIFIFVNFDHVTSLSPKLLTGIISEALRRNTLFLSTVTCHGFTLYQSGCENNIRQFCDNHTVNVVNYYTIFV